MIKGIQKNMIWVQTPRSHCFEEAYFVVRRGMRGELHSENEMLREAARILAEHEAMNQRDKKKTMGKRGVVVFLVGMLCGSLPVAVLWILSLLVG